MAKKKKRHASLATRIARVKRNLAVAEKKLMNPGRKSGMTAYTRLQRSLRRMLAQQSKQHRRAAPNPTKGGKPVFSSLRSLPAGRYVITKRKGSSRLSLSKFVTRKRRKK